MSLIPRTLDEYRAALTSDGYQDLDELDGIRVGARVRHRAGGREGTVRLLTEKPNSAWSKRYGGRDIEMVVERDRSLYDGDNRLSQLANYHVELIDPPRTAGPTRAEHLAWCKQRALAELDAGSPANALASITSDLQKHPDTVGHGALELGGMLAANGHLSTDREVRDWIDGIN